MIRDAMKSDGGGFAEHTNGIMAGYETILVLESNDVIKIRGSKIDASHFPEDSTLQKRIGFQ